MNLDKVRINLSFELENVSDEDRENIKALFELGEKIDNKKFIDFFSIEKRPFFLASVKTEPYDQTFGLHDVYTHFLTEIDIQG